MTAEDNLLAETDQEEAASRAYVQALAAKAGYVTAQMDFDRDGIDIEVKAGGAMRPSIGIQLKGTINLGEARDGKFQYPLKVRNYNLLRIATQVPRILVVLRLPKDYSKWIEHSTDAIAIRHCAYWASFLGHPETKNANSITVAIPSVNLLDEQALINLLDKSRTGTAL